MFRIFIIWLVSMLAFYTYDYYDTVEVQTDAPIKIEFVSVASRSPKRIYRTRDSGKISGTPTQVKFESPFQHIQNNLIL